MQTSPFAKFYTFKRREQNTTIHVWKIEIVTFARNLNKDQDYFEEAQWLLSKQTIKKMKVLRNQDAKISLSISLLKILLFATKII